MFWNGPLKITTYLLEHRVRKSYRKVPIWGLQGRIVVSLWGHVYFSFGKANLGRQRQKAIAPILKHSLLAGSWGVGLLHFNRLQDLIKRRD